MLILMKLTGNPVTFFIRLFLMLSLIMGMDACSSDLPAPAEATSQAERAITLATQMAVQLKATQEIEQAQTEATIQAMESLLQQADAWPVAIDEKFDDNSINWPTGDGDDPLATIHWEILDGQYRWQATANDPFVWWTSPDMDSYSNFSLGVDLQQLSGPPDGEVGLVFRLADNDYYLFEINASQQYSVYFHNQDGWEALLDWQDSDAISESEPNRLSVIADREFLLLFINEHYLTTLFDTRLTSGSAGVLAGLSASGDRGSWVFDNFTLRSQEINSP
jgi:hypothetical protein